MIEDWYISVKRAAVETLPPDLYLDVTALGGYNTVLIPTVEGEEQWLISAYCGVTSSGYANAHGVPRLLFPPHLMLRIHYPSGQFEWIELENSPYDGPALQRNAAGNECLGPISREHLGPGEWRNAMRRHFQLVCQVVEQRWLLTAHSVTAEEQAVARELQDCIRAAYDKPLLPYYQHYGRHFLAWMERAAK
ncbi:hypothetical protein [Hymenobacter weizhouensis]|uniref:hypothetical protein n=1 Tax=Hymenobacter sp. YIM 151500-1 TaxID=2987689 RepID=UPI0022272862|nr:hypothetical protein [Hymenobacter sp. YIM 151500-1]UYZ64377.1 hypothetical protein OIS53_05880 [Hymenobacter sp. YIM 151500-1]